MLGVVALAAATLSIEERALQFLKKSCLLVWVRITCWFVPQRRKKAIFTTTYCKHGQRRAGKFCFHFDGDSIIILSDMLRHGFKKRTCHQSLAVHGNLPHLPNGKTT
jgi:hypothetical protein